MTANRGGLSLASEGHQGEPWTGSGKERGAIRPALSWLSREARVKVSPKHLAALGTGYANLVSKSLGSTAYLPICSTNQHKFTVQGTTRTQLTLCPHL